MKTDKRFARHEFMPAALIALFAVLLTMMSGGSVYAADEDQYIFGTARECSTYTAGDSLEDSFYYSDQWFSKDPEERNDSLALLSMQLSAAATDDNEGGNGAALLNQMGFEGIEFHGFENKGPEDMAYTSAYRTTGEGGDKSTIIAVVVQSYSFDDEIKKSGWTQNFTVNGSGEDGAKGEHYALSLAANKALNDIADLHNGTEGEVKYWIMGHSRGGALANLIAAKLSAKFGAQGPDIYAYTFESPATLQPEEGQDVKTGYGYIHNYICDDDLVPMVPPWGMSRYGQTHQLNTEEVDAGMAAELARIGSKMKAPEAAGQSGEENKAAEIIGKLVSVIPTRAGYSEQKVDTFTSLEGQEVTIEYSYQDFFIKLMGIVFGDGIQVPGIGDHLNEVLASLDPYVRAYLTEQKKYQVEGDTDAYYYKAAVDLHEKLDSLDEETSFPLSAEDVYVLLKLAAPLAIDEETIDKDPAYAITEEPLSGDLVMAYLMPAVSTFTNLDPLTFSHQFDTAIARLKVLAPAPKLEDITIEIPAPKAGDSVSKAGKDVKKYIEEKGLTWLDVSAKWDTDDLYLKDNRKYYLNITLYAAGHDAAEAPEVSFVDEKGEHAPQARAPEISSKEGLAIVKTAFAYEFGQPAQYKVDFENDYGDVPEAMTVSAGTILKYEEKPEAGTREGYEFGDWYCGDDLWDEVVVLNDKTLSAGWVEEIKEVQVSYDLPRAAETLGSFRTPAKASYHVEGARLEDEDSNVVETGNKNQQLILRYRIAPNSKAARFAEEDGEFTGTVKVNGRTAEVDYDKEEGCLYMTAEFKVKGKVNPLTVKGRKANIKYSKLKKKGQKLAAAKVIKVTREGKGSRSYKLVSAKKGSKSFKKYFKVNSKTGKVTVKKGLKKGTYKVQVKVRAAGDSLYEASDWKKVTSKVRVR